MARSTERGVTAIPDPFHLRVAQVALSVADRHGFALGGGHALLAHGLVHRPTEDVDLFTDVDGGVRTATTLVRAALADAGLAVEAPPEASELTEMFYGMDDAFEELDVSSGDQAVRISLGRLPRAHAPVVMSVGPVLHLDDLLGSKTCALATRGQVRDYIDVGAALRRGYDRERLLAMARQHDPGLGDDEVAASMRRLDALPDEAFGYYGLDAAAVTLVRAAFTAWPR
ncbi:nucleotidyl transferase AbiEii/AbiGii toxin family protein [Actinomycetes bacterium KLBMP 9797]